MCLPLYTIFSLSSCDRIFWDYGPKLLSHWTGYGRFWYDINSSYHAILQPYFTKKKDNIFDYSTNLRPGPHTHGPYGNALKAAVWYSSLPFRPFNFEIHVKRTRWTFGHFSTYRHNVDTNMWRKNRVNVWERYLAALLWHSSKKRHSSKRLRLENYERKILFAYNLQCYQPNWLSECACVCARPIEFEPTIRYNQWAHRTLSGGIHFLRIEIPKRMLAHSCQ